MLAPIIPRSWTAGRSIARRAFAAVAATAVLTATAWGADKSASGQKILDVDWKSAAAAAAPVPVLEPGGPDEEKLAILHIPVLAFAGIPQLVKNVAGQRPKQIEPRTVVVDPKQPYWYQITETYDGITVGVSADRRVNHTEGSDFQIGEQKSGAAATLGSTEKPMVSILDGRSEEGMEGLLITYTVHKFPDIPYTVNIECAKRAVSQCKDIDVITRDEGLLRVISMGAGK